MFQQRYSSSGLSTKTLSRSKFINRTIQQPHDVSTESGKQGRTLRYQNKNKSCLIPRHLAQSIESHIVCSNQSNKYKTNSKNRQTLKIPSNAQNINPNIQKKSSKHHYDLNSKGNLIESKLTQPQNQYMSGILGQPQIRFSYKPFLSVPDQQSHLKGNILSRLSDLTQNMESLELGQNNISSQLQRVKNSMQVVNHKTVTNMMRQKILQREVKQGFLYKNMQLTKALQQMHRFCISITELKWICEQVNVIIKKYNHQITTYYQEFSTKYQKRSDLQNILNESQQLLKRFNQIEIMNTTTTIQSLFNFNNLLANNIISKIDQKDDKSTIIFGCNQQQKYTQTKNSLSPTDNQNSWSQLIENIQQHPNKHEKIAKNATCNNLQTLTSEQNKNVTIRTFQATQTNSPSKNKTLNQLIRLSQLRKTEFMSNYDSCNKENYPNKINVVIDQGNKQESVNDNNNYNKFIKKNRLSDIGIQQISPDKDPFNSIHLPHFSTKPQTTPALNNYHQPHQSIFQSQQLYESQISRLTKLIENANQQNAQIHRKMDTKNQQLVRQNEQLKVKILKQQESFSLFQQAIYKIVQTALNQLVSCAKANETLVEGRRGCLSMNSLESIGFNNHQQQLPKSQSIIIMGNKSFFQLVHCLEQVFKLNRFTLTTTTSPQTLFSFSATQNKITQNPTTSQKPHLSSHNVDIDKLLKQKDSLLQEIDELSILKSQLEQEIIKQQQDLKQQIRVKNETSATVRQNYNQLTQIIFAQAFTIEDMLQMEHEDDDQ